MLSDSVAEISAEGKALVSPLLLSNSRFSVHKNDRISNALSADISATEREIQAVKLLLTK